MILAVRAVDRDDLALVAAAAERGLRMAVRAPGQVLAGLPRPLAERLAAAGSALEWLGGGWADPLLAMLPRRDRRLQLQADSEAIEAAVGASPTGAWPALSAWQGFLAEILATAGLRYALVEGAAFAGPPRVGVVDHLGTTLSVLPLGGEVTALAPADLAGLVSPGDLVTPSEYLEAHPPSERVALTEDWPGEMALGWRLQLTADPGGELLYRKMVRLSSRWGDRLPSPSRELLMGAQAHELYLGGFDREGAHRLLIAARNADRRAGPVVTATDFDADGQDELVIELPELAGVLDPGTSSMLYLDDRSTEWPAIMRPATINPSIASEVVSVGEHRGRVEVHLTAPGLDSRFVFADRTVEIELAGAEADPVGPILPLNLRGGERRLRVDGGRWIELAGRREVSGHRFRLQAAERGVLITLVKPGDLRVEAADHELVVRPQARRSLQMTLELT